MHIKCVRTNADLLVSCKPLNNPSFLIEQFLAPDGTEIIVSYQIVKALASCSYNIDIILTFSKSPWHEIRYETPPPH